MSNFRIKKQKEELLYLQDKLDFIKQESKYRLNRRYFELIKKNFIQYNEATTDLIIKIYKNIYCNYSINGIPTSFLITAKQLTDKNTELNISKSVSSTKNRLRILEEEGVIGRIMFPNRKGGQFIYIKQDITKTFNRSKKEAYKVNEITTTPGKIDLVKIDNTQKKEILKQEKEQEKLLEQQEIDITTNEDNFLQIDREKIEARKKQIDLWLKQEEENTLKEQEKFEIEKNITPFMDIEDEENNNDIDNENDIVKQLKEIDIGDNNKEEFVSMFYEFIGKRENSKGETLKAKNKQGVTLTLNKLVKAKQEGYDPYNVLLTSLGNQWQGIFYTDDSKIDKVKPIKQYVKIGGYAGDLQQTIKLQDLETLQQTKDITKTITYQAEVVNKLSKQKAIKDTEKKFNEIAQEKQEKSIRVYNACKRSNKKEPFDKNLFLNVLDRDTGENSYYYLMECFASKIQNKYPQDKERYKTFAQLCSSILTIIRETKQITYLPLLYVFDYMTSLDNNWVDVISYDLLDGLNNVDKLNNWIKDDIFRLKYDSVYEEGEWYQKVIGYDFAGFDYNDFNKKLSRVIILKNKIYTLQELLETFANSTIEKDTTQQNTIITENGKMKEIVEKVLVGCVKVK